MSIPTLLAAFFVGLLLGALLAYFHGRIRSATLGERLAAADKTVADLTGERQTREVQASALREQLSQLVERASRAEAALAAEQGKAQELVRAEDRLKEAFAALASHALRDSNSQFLDLAQQTFGKLRETAQGDLDARKQAVESLVKPISETLEKVEKKIDAVEQGRREAEGGLKQYLDSLGKAQGELKTETASLVRALRAPTVRGRWGEMQLRRVVEIAGMDEHCDFVEQETHAGEEGAIRPDLIVLLPGRRQIAVDAKAPLEHYLNALEATDEDTRRDCLRRHAALVREHVKQLGSKAYWEKIEGTPDFVVLFMGDAFYAAAVQEDPTLFEYAVEKRVLLATPMMLIGLLRTVAHSWRQETLEQNAREISRLGRELHDRIGKVADHLRNLRKGLSKAVEAYNAAIGSLESRVLVSARRFPELGIAVDKQIPSGVPVDVLPRGLSAPEFDAVEEESHDLVEQP
jgi:DNA recombination protein RmuC